MIGTYVFSSGSRFFGYSHANVAHIILIPNSNNLYTLRHTSEEWVILGKFIANNN